MKFKIFLFFLILGIATYFSYTKITFVQKKIDYLLIKYTPIEQIPGNKFYRAKEIEKINSYYKLDKYAKEAPKKYEKDMTTLVNYLIKPANSEMEKVRVLFTWIATHIRYDDDSYNSVIPSQTAQKTFKSKKAVCSGYSHLFSKLLSIANIKSKAISGYSKGYGYTNGYRFKKTTHAWNVVYIDNKWRLFDVTWAAGYGKKVEGKLVSTLRFDDYWFDVNPKEFIFSHLPKDSNWQLIPEKISLSKYETLIKIEHSFFKYFNIENFYNDMITGKIKEIPKIYSINAYFKIVTVPISKTLLEKNYNFKIRSKYINNIVIINNKKWIYLKKDGDLFYIKYKPKRGFLKISIKIEKSNKSYFTFIKYNVK